MAMKKLIVLIAFIMISLGQSYTQTRVEITGNKNVYIGFKISGYYNIWNKNNVLLNSEPAYLINNEVIPPISVQNTENLTPIVVKYFSSYFKKYSGTFKSYETLDVGFYSDMDGTIKEIKLIYPDKIGLISGTEMERFECEVLKSGVRLNFNKNNSVFKGSTYVSQYKAYSAEKLKNGIY